MATVLTPIPVYGGVSPNKDRQTQEVFDGAADGYIAYEYDEFVPGLNVFVTDMNTLSTELETLRDTTITYSDLSQSYSVQSGIYATNSNNSAVSASSSASSAGTALAAANAILGLGISTSYVDASGHLIFFYDDGTVAVPPSLNANGHLILSIEV
jgi:hypothetical protein